MELASFKKRIFVYLIDFLIALMIGIGASVPLFLFTSMPYFFALLFAFLFTYLAYFLINIFIMHISKGYTLGGLILWVRNVNEDGSTLTYKKIIERNLYLGLLPLALINAIDYFIHNAHKLVLDRLIDIDVIDVKKSHF